MSAKFSPLAGGYDAFCMCPNAIQFIRWEYTKETDLRERCGRSTLPSLTEPIESDAKNGN